jgi:hypothetical protein
VNELRKPLVLLLIIPLVAMLAGCGGPSAEQVLKDSMRASKEVKTAHFDMEEVTRLPRAPITQGKVGKRNYVQKSQGDYDLRTGDFKVSTNVLGMTITALQVGDKQYWQIAGNWYEVPQAVQITPPLAQTLSVSQYIKYFKDVRSLPDKNIDGSDCYHVQAVPDMKDMVKQPGISDLLKDPSGKQIRTIDELEELQAVFEFYIQKDNNYFRRSEAVVESRAPNELIQIGYAEPGDNIKQTARVTFSNFNEKLDLKAPENVKPWEGTTPAP